MISDLFSMRVACTRRDGLHDSDGSTWSACVRHRCPAMAIDESVIAEANRECFASGTVRTEHHPEDYCDYGTARPSGLGNGI